jgi:hypothetical protein
LTTQAAEAAYDADPTTYARLSAKNTSVSSVLWSDCTWLGFPNVAAPTALTLTVIAELTVVAPSDPSTITALIGGSTVTLLSRSTSRALTTYTADVPLGTNLGDIQIEAVCGAQTSTGTGTNELLIHDINIQ